MIPKATELSNVFGWNVQVIIFDTSSKNFNASS